MAENSRLLSEWKKAATGFFVCFLLLYVALLHTNHGLIFDAHNFVLGRDFMNLWVTGQLALGAHPEIYYHSDNFTEALRNVAGADYWPGILSYPPTQFLLGIPFGKLPYLLAYVLWLALNLGAFFLAARPLLRGTQWQLALLSPAALIWLLCGQSSLITTSLILAAWFARKEKPWHAGIFIGLLIIKPQLALLFPILLLLERNWRAFISAALTVLVLISITLVCFGTEPWIAYWNIGIPEQVAVFVDTTDMVASLSPTIFNDLRLIHVPAHVAFMVQSFLSLSAVALLIVGVRRFTNPTLQLLFFLTLSLLMTCYLLSYDLVPFSIALVLVASTIPLTKREGMLLSACYALPLLDFALNAAHIPGPSFLPIILLGWLWASATPASPNPSR